MYKVTVNGKTVYAREGTLLSEILKKADTAAEHPCGGKGICRKCTVTVNGKEVLSCQYKILSDITVELSVADDIVSETGAEESGSFTDRLCLVLDIGTTTLALAAVSLDERKIIKVITRTNLQRKFGADVMSRIEYCRKNGISELNKTLISQINQMTAEIGVSDTDTLYVAGNTAMLHMFFGVDCSAMGVSPYTPSFLESKTERAQELGLKGINKVISLPCIASFVGADIVAGLNFIGMPENDSFNLLADLGTNAEIVLFNKDFVLCTSAAAGPCFEGANISSGMSATSGAIYSFCDNKIKTVGDAPARGICSTGLVDVISELLRRDIIDETGYMECETFDIAEGVSLEQGDIRQYQLAKSAVYSAILTLLKIKNISFESIDKMYISGGFSARMNIPNAVRTGLLPGELSDKCIAINNSSLLGTVKYVLEKNDLGAYCNNAVYADLSSDAFFSELFINNMMFDI